MKMILLARTTPTWTTAATTRTYKRAFASLAAGGGSASSPSKSSSSLLQAATGGNSSSGDKNNNGLIMPHQKQTRTFNSLNQNTPFQLCFVRHGQSTWNRDNRFIGWTDTPLTDDGVLEARVAGQMLYRSGVRFDEAHTSLLRRSIRTANLLLMELGQEYIPVYKNWRLNERSYGALVGKNKKECVMQFGKDQVKRWRRSFDEPPPPMEDDHPYHPRRDPRYRLMLDKIPKSESLFDTMKRASVYWDKMIAPALREGKTLLIVGHENNLRALIMRLEGISPEDIINLSIPRAVPLAYRLDEYTLKPLDRPDGRLDEATGFLRGEWLGGDHAVSQILNRDDKQVYDTSIQHNLELRNDQDTNHQWFNVVVGKPSPEAKAKGSLAADKSLVGSSPTVMCLEQDRERLEVLTKRDSKVKMTDVMSVQHDDDEKAVA